MPFGKARFYLTIAQYKSLAWLAKRVPRSFIRVACRVAGRIGPRIAPKKRIVVGAQLSKVYGRPATDDEIQTTFASYVRYWFDAFRVPSLTPAQASLAMSADGFQNIRNARTAGKGMILALPHTGNWDVAGAWLVANDVPLTVVAEMLEPQAMFEWFSRFRSSFGLKVVANTSGASSKLLTALKANEAIALLCDRDIDGTGGQYDFFGEVTRIPKGPATLALRSGAALIPVAVYERGDTYRARIMAPIEVKREGKLSADVDRVTEKLVDVLEELISAAPEQWHVFQPNWPSVRTLIKDR